MVLVVKSYAAAAIFKKVVKPTKPLVERMITLIKRSHLIDLLINFVLKVDKMPKAETNIMPSDKVKLIAKATAGSPPG